ncbi:Hypp1522 [Branchiostoma lanceolatum]|uniref:Hypp1522 protein n=1 Tax=Branchiostoma lanceolatum TaxID=7740 RepID=A0A8J9ZJZ1_BRALA|nr:Hypp1522 [Branchiostoma lanceolatum]
MSDMEDENPRNNRGAKWQKEWGRLRSFLGGSTRLTRRQSQWQKGDGFTMVDLDLEGKPLQTSEIDGERQQDAETDCFGKNCQIFKDKGRVVSSLIGWGRPVKNSTSPTGNPPRKRAGGKTELAVIDFESNMSHGEDEEMRDVDMFAGVEMLLQ